MTKRRRKVPFSRERVAEKKDRTGRIIAGLKEDFPNADCSLSHETPLQLLIATILSAQCTDERVNRVTPELFRRFPTAQAFADGPVGEIEAAIHSTGFFRNKAKNIQLCCADLVSKYGGEVPDCMEALTALAGVGRKTANVVLGNAFGKAEGVVVDTHVRRIANRLRLTRLQDPVKIEKDLMKLVPRQDWTIFPHLFILHGRATCTARSPSCAECRISIWCPADESVT